VSQSNIRGRGSSEEEVFDCMEVLEKRKMRGGKGDIHGVNGGDSGEKRGKNLRKDGKRNSHPGGGGRHFLRKKKIPVFWIGWQEHQKEKDQFTTNERSRGKQSKRFEGVFMRKVKSHQHTLKRQKKT